MIRRRQMMPMDSARASRRVCLDANAVIDYIREQALHDLGMRPASRRAEILRRRLAQTRNVLVSRTAAKEARHNLEKDLVEKLDWEWAGMVVGKARWFMAEYCRTKGCNDFFKYVPTARKMYSTIRSDPANKKLLEWKIKKSRYVDNPVLGSDENDLRILSTAACDAGQHAVDLWTHDKDFTMFADEIWNELGVKVVDSHRLDA